MRRLLLLVRRRRELEQQLPGDAAAQHDNLPHRARVRPVHLLLLHRLLLPLLCQERRRQAPGRHSGARGGAEARGRAGAAAAGRAAAGGRVHARGQAQRGAAGARRGRGARLERVCLLLQLDLGHRGRAQVGGRPGIPHPRSLTPTHARGPRHPSFVSTIGVLLAILGITTGSPRAVLGLYIPGMVFSWLAYFVAFCITVCSPASWAVQRAAKSASAGLGTVTSEIRATRTTPPVVRVDMSCYHTETYTTRDSEGRTQTRTRTVTTWRGSHPWVYSQFRDTFGPVDLSAVKFPGVLCLVQRSSSVGRRRSQRTASAHATLTRARCLRSA